MRFFEKHKDLPEKISFYLRNIIGFFFFPIMTFFLTEGYTHNVFEKMRVSLIWFNFLFYWLLALMLFGLIGRLKIALRVESVAFAVLGLANYYVYQFRGNPILPWDIYSLRVAGSVAGNYDYSLSFKVARILFLFVCLYLCEGFVCDARIVRRKAARISLTALSVIAIGIYTHVVQMDSMVSRLHLYDKLFTPDTMQFKDGSVVAFMMELEYLTVDKPEGYSEQAAQKILTENGGVTADADSLTAEHTPNIIVIMNEAFSDPAVLCEVNASEDYMPYVHSLMDGADNTVSGYLNVSVLGGNTANTEFEFLTGNTMAFLTDGAVAYQQYIFDEIPSIVNLLNAYSYETIAMHPYNATGWNRSTVYPYLGFEKMLFKDDFDHPELIRNYVSDAACFSKIEELYEENGNGDPMFIFNVTMQNHGSYTKESDNWTPDVTVEGVDEFATLNYLSLIKRSDASFEDLCHYFEEQDEDTLIVMFGDHQPTTSVFNPLVKAQGGNINDWSVEERNAQYKVPFVIWANYDIEEASGVETSVNYLGSRLLKIAGIDRDGFGSYLEELSQSFPVISARRVVTADDVSYDKDDALKELSEELSTYQVLQYYNLFDYELGEVR